MADVAVPGLLLCVRRELPYFPTYSHRRARPPARTKATASVSASASATATATASASASATATATATAKAVEGALRRRRQAQG